MLSPRMTETQSLDRNWEFRRLNGPPVVGSWIQVELPHCPFVADLDGRDHWLGECEYRRQIRAVGADPTARQVLFVSAAMHTAQVLVDGREVARHSGGYLPFAADLTAALRDGKDHELVLRLDNRENADVPPGKPYGELDFCWYGGLYRGVELRAYPALHITEPVAAGEAAGGGVFLRTLEATEERAAVRVRTHVRNAGPVARAFRVRTELRRGGVLVAAGVSTEITLDAGGAGSVELDLELGRPALWSPASPELHDAEVTVCGPEGVAVDARSLRFGVRRIGFSRSGGFTVNGRRLRLRGTNRHQEFPRVGYALPAAGQWRDARRIKEAGFDYVRLSHYPQSPDFLDACDALGLVVMNCIPGWQFCGGERFQAACLENARQLIRRDRNHACVVLWELSLNETQMDEAFMARLHAVGHDEYPGDQMFTCGWIDRFDVFIHSRQHGRIHSWQNGDKALVVAEYGDWEFYAANEGFDQATGAGVLPAETNSRQFRGDGERRLRQQALNHMAALDDTLASPAVLDGQWTVFDYARGYHPVRAACGVMDVFRVPKFSYHFYRSQRDPFEGGEGWTGGAVVFVASLWTPDSDPRVLVFSNCEEVELFLNGRSYGRKNPTLSSDYQHLPHPPVVFELPRFEAGTLEAVGWIGGAEAARHRVATPGKAARLALVVDSLGLAAAAGEADVLTAHASVLDAQGMLCVGDGSTVNFAVEGGAEIVGPVSVSAEAGVASIVVRVPPGATPWHLTAETGGMANPLTAVWPEPGGALREGAVAAPATE